MVDSTKEKALVDSQRIGDINIKTELDMIENAQFSIRNFDNILERNSKFLNQIDGNIQKCHEIIERSRKDLVTYVNVVANSRDKYSHEYFSKAFDDNELVVYYQFVTIAHMHTYIQVLLTEKEKMRQLLKESKNAEVSLDRAKIEQQKSREMADVVGNTYKTLTDGMKETFTTVMDQQRKDRESMRRENKDMINAIINTALGKKIETPPEEQEPEEQPEEKPPTEEELLRERVLEFLKTNPPKTIGQNDLLMTQLPLKLPTGRGRQLIQLLEATGMVEFEKRGAAKYVKVVGFEHPEDKPPEPEPIETEETDFEEGDI